MSKKLCKLVKAKVQKEDPSKYTCLIKGAKFYCKSCGRAAAKASVLCKSEKL